MVSVGLCVHHSHLKVVGGTADFSPNLGIVKPHHFLALEKCLASRSAAEDLYTSAQMEHADELRMCVCFISLWWTRGEKEDDTKVAVAVAVAQMHLLYQQQQVVALNSNNRLKKLNLLMHISLKTMWCLIPEERGKRSNITESSFLWTTQRTWILIDLILI